MVKQPNATPVLEITEEYTGLWDINGKLLYFRLFENGLGEFETIDNSKKTREGINKTDDIKVQRQIYLSQNDLDKILKIIRSEEFINLQDSYTPKRSCIDNFISTTIKVQIEDVRKSIQINGHCDNLSDPNKDSFPTFPTVLSNLFKELIKPKLPKKTEKFS